MPWAQLIRLRYAIGPGAEFFNAFTQRVLDEAEETVARSPLPYVLEHRGVKVTFKDIWSQFDEAESPPDPATGS